MSAPARNDSKPPRQNPTVATASRPVRSRSAASAAAASCWTLGTVSCWTWGMYSNSSSRGPRPGGPAEVVERDRVVAGLGEPLGELGVERVQAADVGEDHDPAAASGRRLRERGREVRAVGGRQLEHLGARATGDRGEQKVLGRRRRPGVEVEAHAARQNRGMTEATTSATDPATFRAQFPVLERLSYLNAGTEGPIPRAAAEAVRRRIDAEAEGGRCGRPYFEALMELAAKARAGYATALGCEPADVALTGSTTDGVNTVIAGLDLRAGDEILTSDQEHPGLLAPLGRRAGAGTASRSASSRSPSSPARSRARRG